MHSNKTISPGSSLLKILICIIILYFPGTANSNGGEGRKESNYHLLDSLAGEAAGEIGTYLQRNNVGSVVVKFGGSNADWLIKKHIIKEFARDSISIVRPSADSSSSAAHLQIIIEDIGIFYKNIEDEFDLLKRTARLKASIISEKPEGIPGLAPLISLSYTDIVNRAQIESLESDGFEFCKGEVPEQPSSFFKSALEPAIVVAATVVTVVLLFTVRSK